MLLTRFEALGLLPDKEYYQGFTHRGGHRHRWSVDLEQLLEIVPDGLICLCQRQEAKQVAPLLQFNVSGHACYLDVDMRKFRRFFKALGAEPALVYPPDYKGPRVSVKMPKKNDPYSDRKTYHKIGLVAADGRVSALCFKTPRAAPKTAAWTTTDSQVTCKKCLRKISQTT